MPDTDHASVIRAAVRAAIEADTSGVADLFTDDVCGWAPNVFVESREQLLALLYDREDALTDIDTSIDSIDVIGDKAIAEWRTSATFSHPFLVDEDILIEPNGARLLLAGVTIAEFEGEKIKTFRSYFDDAALLEQMLVAP